MAFDYVKFRRGNTDAFSALNPKDPNTLYFVYSNPAAKRGLLYLGDKLIGCGSFSEIVDVDVEDAQPGYILIYTNVGTEEEPEWVWKASSAEILPLIPDDAIMPEGSNLDPGDTLSQAIMKLDAAITENSSDTWRPIYVNDVQELSEVVESGHVNFAAGEGIVLEASNGTITISIDAAAIEELIENKIEELVVPYEGDEPGLVPPAPEPDPQDAGDNTGNYVLSGDGTWVNITNLGPFWEELNGIIIPDFSEDYDLGGGVFYSGYPLELAEEVLEELGVPYSAEEEEYEPEGGKSSRKGNVRVIYARADVVHSQDKIGYYKYVPDLIVLKYHKEEPQIQE